MNVSPDPISSCTKGNLVSLVSRAKTPFFASHWKYLIPPTEPSFLPKNNYFPVTRGTKRYT